MHLITISEFMRKNRMEKEEATDKLTIIAGDFNTLISTIDRKTRQKINKHTEDLNRSNDQHNLIYMYKTLLPPKKKHSSQQLETSHSFQVITKHCQDKPFAEP